MSDIWEDRRVKIGYESAEELAKHYNPLNYRGHPDNQRNATEESLDALGYVGSIKKSLNSGVVLDGHLRIEIALAKDPSIQLPVDYYDLTPDEELLALQVLDATTEMAEPIADKLAALMERTRAIVADKPGLVAMLEGLRVKAGVNGGSWGDAFGSLPTGEKSPFQQMTFTLHDEQVNEVMRALNLAKQKGDFEESLNENSNGNALTFVCETFITMVGNGQG